jgi:hypothetical protein
VHDLVIQLKSFSKNGITVCSKVNGAKQPTSVIAEKIVNAPR